MMVDPIMKAVHTLEGRLALIESTIALLSGAFTTQQLTTRQLCVSDETGAQTCLSKAQLDALLGHMGHAATTECPATVTGAPAAIPETDTPAIVLPPPAEIGSVVSPVVEPPSAVTTGEAAIGPVDELSAPSLTAPGSAAVPAETEDTTPRDKEHTGSVITAPPGTALVWYPEVEVSVPAAAPPNE
jgi:hypothetical protein